MPHRGREAHQGGVRQPLLVQGLQESRGDGDKPRVGPMMPGERLVEGKKGMAELLMCLPVRQAERTLLLFLPYEASGKVIPWESNPGATPSPPRHPAVRGGPCRTGPTALVGANLRGPAGGDKP